MSIVVDRPAKLRSPLTQPLSEWPRDPVGSMPEQPVPNEAELLAQHQGWVHRVVHMYGRTLTEMMGKDEALAVAQIGMLHAIRVWDPERGSLTSLGLQWMRSRITKAVRYEKWRSGGGKTRSLDVEAGRAGSGFCFADMMQLEDTDEGAGQCVDGEEVAMWLMGKRNRGADIALDLIGTGDKSAVVGRRWGIGPRMVQNHRDKWLRLARLHFDAERKRRVC